MLKVIIFGFKISFRMVNTVVNREEIALITCGMNQVHQVDSIYYTMLITRVLSFC